MADSGRKRTILAILFSLFWFFCAMPFGCVCLVLYMKKSVFIQKTYDIWYVGLLVLYILGMVLICRNKRKEQKEVEQA